MQNQSGSNQLEKSKFRTILYVAVAVILTAFITGNITAKANNTSPAIEIDPQNRLIRFIVDGQDIAIIDAEGMHVFGDITYSGTITDIGSSRLEEGQNDE